MRKRHINKNSLIDSCTHMYFYTKLEHKIAEFERKYKHLKTHIVHAIMQIDSFKKIDDVIHCVLQKFFSCKFKFFVP